MGASPLDCRTQTDCQTSRQTNCHAVRIYYEDTDAAGIVYYANYLRYLERGRTEWLRALGFAQSELARESGVAFAVRAVQVEYLRAARLDDQLTIETHVETLKGAQLTFAQTILRGEETLITAQVRVACIDVAGMRPTPIPPTIRARLKEATCK